LRDIASYWSKIEKFLYPPVSGTPARGDPVGISWRYLMLIKLEWLGYRIVKKIYDNTLSRSVYIQYRNVTDGQADRQTNGQRSRPLGYTRYRHSYYGVQIGTHMPSIKWCQWPWTNPNPVFKVTSFFDAEYLTNSYRYGHSYYRRRIANHTQAFEWHHFQWPWVTSKPDFKVTILFNVK